MDFISQYGLIAPAISSEDKSAQRKRTHSKTKISPIRWKAERSRSPPAKKRSHSPRSHKRRSRSPRQPSKKESRSPKKGNHLESKKNNSCSYESFVNLNSSMLYVLFKFFYDFLESKTKSGRRSRSLGRRPPELRYILGDAKFFLIKSNNYENVALAQAKGVWSTPPINESKLNNAYRVRLSAYI